MIGVKYIVHTVGRHIRTKSDMSLQNIYINVFHPCVLLRLLGGYDMGIGGLA